MVKVKLYRFEQIVKQAKLAWHAFNFPALKRRAMVNRRDATEKRPGLNGGPVRTGRVFQKKSFSR